jgi:amino-acid N-acetyltransferase
MAPASLSLEPCDHSSIPTVERLLEANDLPSDDVADKPAVFYLARSSDESLGIGGIEQYGRDGLLRSVVIAESARGKGLGGALVHALEAEAARDGIERLFLLTTTAADFFAHQGYEEIDRDVAPAPIQATTQFDELCPSSATCMRKEL